MVKQTKKLFSHYLPSLYQFFYSRNVYQTGNPEGSQHYDDLLNLKLGENKNKLTPKEAAKEKAERIKALEDKVTKLKEFVQKLQDPNSPEAKRVAMKQMEKLRNRARGNQNEWKKINNRIAYVRSGLTPLTAEEVNKYTKEERSKREAQLRNAETSLDNLKNPKQAAAAKIGKILKTST
ncbi:hypothetical protein JW911_04020 [Candidatus Peregrinibacteria bacterium]|nr:hypothetical protein [Candidatus Peregrinibacteria bacterium]